MAVAWRLLLAAVLLLVFSGLHCSSPPAACPESCICQGAALLNCSSSGLSSVPQRIQDSVTVLDLSHNLLGSVTLLRAHRNLRNVWLGNNSIAHLSLCIERNVGSQNVTNRHLRRLKPWSRRGCVSWAPSLQLLSVEKNQLEQLPEGLEGSKSLQVLQLSFNRISTLRPGDFRNLPQLKELHLQHNLITSLHPQMFQHLAQLRVLDLSFNMLTSLHPLMYPSLRNIGADVRLDGNRWCCDCSMRSLRRRMVYDNSRGLQAWGVVCDSPSMLSGKDLLQLEEEDLNCLSTEDMSVLHRDVTVYSGSDILLSCSTQDPVWWTPSGQTSVSQPQVIRDITERDTGLYVCVSEGHRVVSVFNLQISKMQGTRRNTRSLSRSNQQMAPRDTPNSVGQERNQPSVSHSQLTLAVCLSVFITFVIAFILGVLARPCIDVLWKRLTTKKRSSATNSGSSVEQRQYDNEAYSSGEEPGQIPTHRERRVTFSTIDISEDGNVHYYDTVAGGSQGGINKGAVVECEVAVEKRQTAASANTLQDKKKYGSNMEFEPIPDPVDLEEGSLSSSLDSSASDKVFREKQTTQRDPTITKTAKDSSGIPEFTSEPFADWSPHTHNHNSKGLDLWQEKEEQFEFSDSVRSTSDKSSIVFDSSNDVAPTSNKHKRGDTSSSSSYVSEGEPTQYTVNSDHEEAENIERTHTNSDYRYDTQRPPVRPEHSSSSDSSDSDCKPVRNEGKDTYTSEMDKPSSRGINRVPSLSTESSSSSDSEDEATHHVKPGKMNVAGKFQESPSPSGNLQTQFPAVDLNYIPHIKRRLDIKATSPGSDLTSGSDSENGATHHTDRPRKVEIAKHSLGDSGRYDSQERRPVIDEQTKGPSPASTSSSSSDSEDELLGHTEKERPGKVDVAELRFQETPILGHKATTHFPALDLERVPRIERRLDIKVPSVDPDSSSSSDSEDETTGPTEKQKPAKVDVPHKESQKPRDPVKTWSSSSSSSDSEDEAANIKKQEQGHLHTAKPTELTQTVRREAETGLSVLDIDIKSHLDTKAAPSDSDSSSSSDSEDESPTKQDTALNLDARWSALDLQHVPHIKRRLDIKAPSPASDSSSSSDSEDEAAKYIKKPEQSQTHVTRPVEISQNVRRDPDSDSSSSSDSEDETVDPKETQKVGITELPLNDLDARWPALELQHVPHIKRRLDIKTLLPAPYSPPNSEVKKHEQREVYMSKRPYETDNRQNLKAKWPALDFENISIKRRLDIKAPSQDSDSSSNSDNETTRHTERPETVNTEEATFQKPPKISPDLKTDWPTVNQEDITGIKRRLDFKARRPSPGSSSSSDSETASLKVERDRSDPRDVGIQKNDHETTLGELKLGIPHITRRLDIKARPPPDLVLGVSVGSQQSSSDSSSSDSEDEKTKETEFMRLSKSPLKNISDHPKPEPNITLKKYTVITDSSSAAAINDNSNVTAEINPELHSRWATMNLGISRFRKRLEITSHAPPSSLSDVNERWKATPRLPVDTDKEASPIHTESETYDVEMKDKLVESDSAWPKRTPTTASDISAHFQTESSSSSDSEDEMIHRSVPELRPGVPRIKRYLNIKAPSPDQSDSSSSCSEGEGQAQGLAAKESRHGSNVSGMTDSESVITYKRSIMKAPSLPSKSQPTTIPNQYRSITDLDLPPQIRWTGISRHLSDLSVYGSRNNLDVEVSSPQQVTATAEPDNSAGRTNEVLKTLSEERREKKGLSALKVMSSERQTWDADDALDLGPQRDTSFNYRRFEEDVKLPGKRPLKQLHFSSTSADEKRAAELLYGITRYRRHDTGDMKPPQEAPPPVPETPPPDEAAELTWRSPQRMNISDV